MQVIATTLWNFAIVLKVHLCMRNILGVHETAATAHRECLRRASWLQNRRPWEGCVARAHGHLGPRTGGHPDSSSTNRRVTEQSHGGARADSRCRSCRMRQWRMRGEEEGRSGEGLKRGELDGGSTDEARRGWIYFFNYAVTTHAHSSL
jgi:hypothetical protein